MRQTAGLRGRAQGTHTAMKSGMLAAEAAFDALTSGAAAGAPADLSAYEPALRESWICDELSRVRNIRPGYAALLVLASHVGMWARRLGWGASRPPWGALCAIVPPSPGLDR